jgi:flagellar biosynthesis/type III secretory pathway protein FliH
MLKEDMMRIFNEEFKSQIEHARNLAFQEAKREGMKEGKKEGMKEGEEKIAKSVLEMFDSGKSPEEIKAYLKTNFIK